jgi:hypothetical protein
MSISTRKLQRPPKVPTPPLLPIQTLQWENMEPTPRSTSSNLRNRSDEKRIDDLSLHILKVIRDARFCSTDDLHAVFPIERNTLQVRLTKLTKDGFLLRPDAQKFLKRDKGRPTLIYSLGREGAGVLDAQFEDPDVGWPFLLHSLMTTKVYLTFVCGGIHYPTLSFDQWKREPDDMPRVFIPKMKSRFINRPDGLIDLTHSEKQHRFLLECETGKVPRTRTNLRQSSFLRKIFYYQKLFDLTRQQYPHFRVLTVIQEDDLDYLNHLRRIVREADPKEKGLNIFWFTVLSAFDPKEPATALFKPVWYLPGDAEPRTLL